MTKEVYSGTSTLICQQEFPGPQPEKDSEAKWKMAIYSAGNGCHEHGTEV